MTLGLSHSQRARLGALRRYELYGNPGTPEGRSKGGRHTCEYYRLHPDEALKRGFSSRKPIIIPRRSIELANLIGIMLGDGGIRSKYQLTVTYNSKTDKEFAEYVGKLIKRLFGVDHVKLKRKHDLGADILVNSANVISFLIKQGLIFGNKIEQQIDVPDWIKRNKNFGKACIRGLFDTDGSLYCHRYKVSHKWYEYLKLDFTSCSKPLLQSVYKILSGMKIKSSLKGVHIVISAQSDVNRYLAIIGSSNQKFVDKWKRF
ncbi:MAG: LAGLIDADG family homing endonuclease [Candidatus Omnitrophota bacterium]